MVYVIYRSKAKGLTKFVQLLIADFVDPESAQAGPPGPSLDTLAANGGVGKATVIRQVEKLTTLGEVLLERGGRGAGNTHVYIFPRFRDEQAQRSAADQSGGPGERREKRTAKGPQKDRSRRRYMDDPDPDPLARARADKPNPSVTHDRNPGHARDRDNCPACGTGRPGPGGLL